MSNTGSNYRGTLDSNDKKSMAPNNTAYKRWGHHCYANCAKPSRPDLPITTFILKIKTSPEVYKRYIYVQI